MVSLLLELETVFVAMCFLLELENNLGRGLFVVGIADIVSHNCATSPGQWPILASMELMRTSLMIVPFRMPLRR